PRAIDARSDALTPRDVRPAAPRRDAPHPPRGGTRAHVDGRAVVEEPDLRRLPELVRLPFALDVDVRAVSEGVVDLGRQRRGDGAREREGGRPDRETTRHASPYCRPAGRSSRGEPARRAG